MATITVIQPSIMTETVKRRVAAYCRVSSSSEDQLNSYQAQLTYYSHKFEESDTEELVDLYILKEDDQFTTAFLYGDTAYMVWTEQVDYDECRKTIESFVP